MAFKTATPRYIPAAYVRKYLEELSKLAKSEGAVNTDEYIWKLHNKIREAERLANERENKS